MNGSEIIKEAWRALDKKEEKMLGRRYGFDGKPPDPWEKVVAKFKLSMEEFLKIEKRAIRLLRRPRFSRPLNRLLTQNDEAIWDALSDPVGKASRVAWKTESPSERLNRLSGVLLLLVRCFFDTTEKWLAENAMATKTAWVRSAHGKKDILKTIETLDSMRDKGRFPLPVRGISGELDIDSDLLHLGCKLSENDLRVYGEYVAESPLSLEALRTIRVHLLCLHERMNIHDDPEAIRASYNDLYVDDSLTVDHVRKIRGNSPHIFRGSREESPAGAGIPAKDAESGSDRTRSAAMEQGENGDRERCMFERPWDDFTAEELILEIIREKGFCKFMELVELLKAKSGHRYRLENAAAGISLCKELVQVAPSLYGLRGGEAREELLFEKMLDETACRRYVAARFAGEPMGVFQAWSPAMERSWCMWAQYIDNDKLYQSLLNVADPESWPATREEIDEWLERKKWDGIYYFDAPFPSDPEKPPPSLQDLFTIALYAEQLGFMNWIRANTALMIGRKYFGSAPVLMLLVALGVIGGADHWQKRHAIGPNLGSFKERLIPEFRKKGFVHWNDETGRQIAGELCEMDLSEGVGWIEADAFEILVRRFRSDAPHAVARIEKGKSKPKASGAKQLELPF